MAIRSRFTAGRAGVDGAVGSSVPSGAWWDWFGASPLTFYGLLAALLVFSNFYAPAAPTAIQRLLATLLILLCAWPTVLWLAGRQSGQPLLPFFGGLYAAFFASPIFLRDGFYGRWAGQPAFDAAQITEALLLAIVGWACFLIGFLGWRLDFLSRRLPRVRMGWGNDPRLVRTIAIAIGAVALPALVVDTVVLTGGFYTKAVKYPMEFQFLVRFTGQLALLAIALLCLLQWLGELGLAGRIFLWGGLIISYAWLGVGTGVILRGIEPLVAVTLAYSALEAARPWRAILGGTAMFLLFALVLIPTRLDFREEAWKDRTATIEIKKKDAIEILNIDLGDTVRQGLDRGQRYIETITRWARGGSDRYSRWLDAAAFRLDQLTPLAHVIDLTPESAPFRNGSTYLGISIVELPLALAARLRLADPPRQSMTKIARESYGISSGARRPNAGLEGYNFHPMAELVMNFGTLAIPLGMLLLGAVHGAIQRLFVHPGAGIAALATSVPILTISMVRAGSFVSASWGSTFVLAYAVFLVVLCGLMRDGPPKR